MQTNAALLVKHRSVFVQDTLSFSEKLNDLLCHGLHARYGRMSPLLVDVMQFEQRDAIVPAYSPYTLVDRLLEVGVQHEEQFGLRILRLQVMAQLGHGRTEREEVLPGPVAILVVADGSSAPAVVGGGADEDDVGLTEVGETCEERAWCVVLAVVTCVAHRAATVGIDTLDLPSHALLHLPPPGLLHAVHVVTALLMRRREIPYLVGVGSQITLKGGVAVTEDGDTHAVLTLGPGGGWQEKAEDKQQSRAEKTHGTVVLPGAVVQPVWGERAPFHSMPRYWQLKFFPLMEGSWLRESTSKRLRRWSQIRS